MEAIETTKHKLMQPIPIKRDSMENTIEPEAIIAFNRSGHVVLGKIIEVVHNKWQDTRIGTEGRKWWSLRFEMIVEALDGKRSIVKNPNSFVIIPNMIEQ